MYKKDRNKLNRLFADFGFKTADLDKFAGAGLEKKLIAKVESNILELYDDFDFVAITDYFQESMVLMSQKLCFPLTDFTGVPQKMRVPDEVRFPSRYKIPTKTC